MATTAKAAPPVSLFFGNDGYGVTALAKERLAALVPESDRAFGLDPVDGAVESVSAAAQAVRRCLESLDTPSFLGGAKVVWLKQASFLGGTGRAARGADVKRWLERLTDRIRKGLAPGVHFLVTAPEVDKRSAFYKACAKAGDVRECAVTEKSYQVDREAGPLIQAALKEAGMSADAPAVAALVERVGCDPQQIRNEVEKLSLYRGPAARITRADVETLVPPLRDAQPWDLAEALADRNLARCLRVLDRLFVQKSPAPQILAILENQFRELLVYREFLDRGWLRPVAGYGRGSPWDAAPESAAALAAQLFKRDPRTQPGFLANLRCQRAAQFTKAEILQIRKRLLEADRQIKTTGTDPQRLLELMLIRILGAPREPGARPAGSAGRRP